MARRAYTSIRLAVKTSRPHNELDKQYLSWTNDVLNLSADTAGLFQNLTRLIVFKELSSLQSYNLSDKGWKVCASLQIQVF